MNEKSPIEIHIDITDGLISKLTAIESLAGKLEKTVDDLTKKYREVAKHNKTSEIKKLIGTNLEKCTQAEDTIKHLKITSNTVKQNITETNKRLKEMGALRFSVNKNKRVQKLNNYQKQCMNIYKNFLLCHKVVENLLNDLKNRCLDKPEKQSESEDSTDKAVETVLKFVEGIDKKMDTYIGKTDQASNDACWNLLLDAYNKIEELKSELSPEDKKFLQ